VKPPTEREEIDIMKGPSAAILALTRDVWKSMEGFENTTVKVQLVGGRIVSLMSRIFLC